MAALGVVAAGAVLLVGGIQVFGARRGEPCADSYSCRGFLIGAAECVDVESGSYCTNYCDRDAGCSRGWRCLDAHPTALHVQTQAVGKVCVRDTDR